MKFRDFVEQTKDALETVAFSIEGERDVAPMVHLESEAGITVFGVDRQFFVDAGGLELLVTRFIVPLIVEHQARKVGWSHAGWAAPAEGPPSEHPDRREVLLATFVDPEIAETWVAPVIRPGGRVVIGAWEQPAAVSNPLVTTLKEALR